MALFENLKFKFKKKLNKEWEPGPFPYQDSSLSFEERVDDLVSRMTLKEKGKQMCSRAPEIARIGLPRYHWWNECLHGVGRAGLATVFPQSTALGATFNPPLIYKMAKVISDEARAKHHDALRNNKVGKQYLGLTYWSPNVNIFRDPRWGRGQETYGEDPYLMAQIGINFVKGLQGDNDKYLKLVATPKHYVVHSGPESLRHEFNAIANEKDVRETYIYAFKECVEKASAYSIMGAYNRTNGELCCASPTYLQDILRKEFGFEGFVVSDCGAIRDFHAHHKVTKNKYESAAIGVKNGCDLNCGFMYRFLAGSVKRGYISEEEIDVALKRIILARMKLGMFDPEEKVPFSKIPIEKVDCKEHQELALQIARESMVLLKNEKNILPLNSDEIKNIAVIGPNANDKKALWGNYNGTPSHTITPLEGIKTACPNATINYVKGCKINGNDDTEFNEAVEAATKSEIILMFMGISNKIEGEQKRTGGDDRNDIGIPEIQQKLMKLIREKNPDKPIILSIINGSPVSSPWAQENACAIIEAWYGGQEAGTAIADILFGRYSPAGKMPITVPYSTKDLPDFADYNMEGRTYRYLEKEPLYPFGFGLSFVNFEYEDLSVDKDRISTENDENIILSTTIKNTGNMDADEVVQLYIKDVEASVKVPHHSLRNVKREFIAAGQNKKVEFTITPRDLALINNEGKCILEPGKFIIYVGSNQPDERSLYLGGNQVKSIEITVEGTPKQLKY